ncbi:MAG: hypothetical protein JXR96_00725 [Deltaproteobacteria bacterium]|nr:hypothetical protein [Deltaproteobacteria bacterium]
MQWSNQIVSHATDLVQREDRPVNLSAITSEFVDLQIRAHKATGLDEKGRARQELLRTALMLGEKQFETELLSPGGRVKVRMQDGDRICVQVIDRIDEGMFDARLKTPVAIGTRKVVLVEPGPGRPALASYAVAVAPSISDPELTRFRLEKP